MSGTLPTFPTPFIGRADEIADLSHLLDDPNCRLLTLVGPGGIGKTRLAVEVARCKLDTFPDGIYFVALQPLRQVENIVTTIIDGLPLRFPGNAEPLQLLRTYLHDKHLLLVLDNFEHLLDGVAIVTDILSAAPQVKLLVTSRERLNLQAEQVWPVAGLDVPQDTADTADTHSAVQMFVERARRVKPNFTLNDQQDAVIRICQLVDGLPLALELAASWTRVMPCKAIADEIQRNIDILTSSHRDLPERHQSMQAVFEHSWCLLTDEEQVVFPKLAVFRGGFTADAAQQVAGASLQTLASLIDKSLVRPNDNGRYDLHELLRQYAETRLAVEDEPDVIRVAYCEYYTHLINRLEPHLKDRRQAKALLELEADFDNVQNVWHDVIANKNYSLAERLLQGLVIYRELRIWGIQRVPSLISAAYQQLETHRQDVPATLWSRLLAVQALYTASAELARRALAFAAEDEESRAFVNCFAGNILAWRGEFEASIAPLEASLSHFASRDPFLSARILSILALSNILMGQIDRGREHAERSLALARQIGDITGAGRVLAHLGEAALHSAERAAYLRIMTERRALYQDADYPGGARWCDGNYALWGHFCGGDFDHAHALAEEVYQYGLMMGDTKLQYVSLPTLSLVANMREDYLKARQLNEQMLGSREKPLFLYAPLQCSLALSAFGLGDQKVLIQSMRDLMTRALKITSAFWMTWSLPPLILYCASKQLRRRAVELLGLAMTHPASLTGWLEKWPLLSQLRADLEAELGSEAYSSAYEHGTQLDLETVIRESLVQLGDPPPQSALIEPLTDREHEILQLVATGLTNAEIAEALVIALSTVRWHVYNICGKLAASNRTQAVARARELRILQ